MYDVTLLPGDGIGPEVAGAMKRCLDATGVKIKWDEQPVGEYAIQQFGTPLPEQALASIRKNKVAIKGPIVTPVGTGFRSVNVQLRQVLDLYACGRPCKYFPGTKAVAKNVDIMIFRENTEDLYAGIEFDINTDSCKKVIGEINSLQPRQIRADSAISIKPISVTATQRIMKFACEYAVKNNRRKVSIVHKANIMKFTDGLFLRTAQKVGEQYQGKLEIENVIVDNMCMQLVQKPELYDVLVLPNLYGDIVSDLCAGLVGGLGIAPGANLGEGIAVFEAIHGSAPKYAGQNKVNPTAMILSAVLMLDYLGEKDAS